MKLTRKLIPAFVMLLVSAVLMSTASFAWFAMNTNVTATGMQVSANSDSIFLEIKGTEDGTTWKTVGTNALNASLFPAAHEDDLTTVADITDYNNWYYKYSASATDYTSSASPTPLTTFTNYVAHTTYEIRLNPNMVKTAYDLYVSSITIPENKGISVIIYCEGSTKYKEFKATQSTAWASDDDNIADTLTMADANDSFTINVYIYIDGTDSNVYTNNAANLGGEISFALSASGAQRTVGTP